MPIYEYECTKCGHQTEVWQKFSDLPVTKCDMCRGKMKKLISHNTFHLKGSGWYVTDYAKDGSSRGKSEDKPKKKADKTPKDKPEKKAAAASTTD